MVRPVCLTSSERTPQYLGISQCLAAALGGMIDESSHFRSVVSRMVLMNCWPSSVSNGLKLISTGNSVPSLRRAYKFRPDSIGRKWRDSA